MSTAQVYEVHWRRIVNKPEIVTKQVLQLTGMTDDRTTFLNERHEKVIVPTRSIVRMIPVVGAQAFSAAER